MAFTEQYGNSLIRNRKQLCFTLDSIDADKGRVESEPPHGYYHLISLGITTAGYDTTRYSLKGYISIDKNWPDATFAAIYEGTGTEWMAAKGLVTCK